MTPSCVVALGLVAAFLAGTNAFSVLGSLKRRKAGSVSMPPLPASDDNSLTAKAADLSDIFEQNKAWKAAREAKDPDYFKKLGGVNKPMYMWIGCSDARVPANEIMGEMAGTVFVARNIANMVVNTDFNLMSALQYAIEYLEIPHIIICGHYDCSGARFALQQIDHGAPLEMWLRNIRDVYRLHKKELDAIRDADLRFRRLVELNVVEQCINLYKTGFVQRKRVETYQKGDDFTTPRIHALVFDPKIGRLQRLNVDFNKYISEYTGVYDLYDAEQELVREKEFVFSKK